MILADTTLLIDFLRGKKEAIATLQNAQSEGIYTTEINVFELIIGVYAKKQETQKEETLSRHYQMQYSSINQITARLFLQQALRGSR
ncbi:MAG: PIN domain-containing protein [Nanoarchaeota archaeon]